MKQKWTKEERDIRFWRKVSKTKTCWIWLAATDGHGYGVFWNGERLIKAHHYLIGIPPEGMTVDHLCRNRACINPDHLEVVTHAENLRRGIPGGSHNTVKTHCPHGHPYTDDNTYVDSRGHRRCRACGKAQMKAWNDAHKGMAVQ